MTQITIDTKTREKLRTAREVVRLVDENGHVIGTFKPADVRPYDPSLFPPTPLEELDRRAAEGTGRPLNELLDEYRRSK